ncbi:MAG: endolytic transglycosylase MltG [Candidatus Methylomirabilales bacterium]
MNRRHTTIIINPGRASRFRHLHVSYQKIQVALFLGIIAAFALAFLLFQNVALNLKQSELRRLQHTVQSQDSLLGAKLQRFARELGRLKALDKGVRRWAGREPGQSETTAVAMGGGTLDLRQAFKEGKAQARKVTIPEGSTLRQIAGLLAMEGLVNGKRFLELATDPSVASSYVPDAETLEGFLFPDTYHFVKGQGENAIIEAMVHRFYQAFPIEDELRAGQRGRSLYEIVTLASIVEKEAVVDREKRIIAAVFYNRLKKGMRLQADPTVLYGRNRRGRIRTRDLRAKHPYNTYIHHGLPPGPIASPGAAALKAVLEPAHADYLYFVSKNNGTHYFSKTLKEHNRAVRKYQLSRRRFRRGRRAS